MKLNKKELEVLDLLLKESRNALGSFQDKFRTSYPITIWGKGRAKAFNTLMEKVNNLRQDGGLS